MSENREINSDETFKKYVSDQIKYFKSQDLLGEESNLTYMQLVKALQKYQSVYHSLLFLKTQTKRNLKNKNREFQAWYDERYLIIKRREHKLELTAQKWSSAKEIDAMTRSENKVEYLQYNSTIEDLEERDSFIQGLIEGWKLHSYTLGNLCGLFKTDYATGNMENKLQ